MHIFTEYVAKYLSLKMLIFGLSWLEHSPSIMSIVFIKKKNATALQQRCCFFPFNTSMLLHGFRFALLLKGTGLFKKVWRVYVVLMGEQHKAL